MSLQVGSGMLKSLILEGPAFLKEAGGEVVCSEQGWVLRRGLKVWSHG